MSSQILFNKKLRKKKQRAYVENQYVSRQNHLDDEDIKKVAEELTDISQKEGLNAQNVLERAKNKNNVLHKHFTWDDTKAAENWRKWQARFLISSVRIVISGVPVQAFESVKIDIKTPERKYVDIVTIKSNEYYRNQLEKQALKEAQYWRNKYHNLQKLNPIFKAIDTVEKEVSDE